MDITLTNASFLSLLQLASPSLPVGAYSYSEGLETLVENDTINSYETLKQWLIAELNYGAIRLDTAVMIRIYRAVEIDNLSMLSDWNQWLSAARDTQELRNASWQMGRSLFQLLAKLTQQSPNQKSQNQKIQDWAAAVGNHCNYAAAFAIAAAHWHIDIQATILAYIQSWATNLITAGIKLIPLGQTSGQLLLVELQEIFQTAAMSILNLQDDDICSCTWGLSLASMSHEVQYTRLFRS
jgi:urease accessory protein